MNAVDAEKAVIGSLLLDPSKVREVVPIVAPVDFGSPVLGGLYTLITGRAATGEAVDAVTLWPAIRADEHLARNIKSAAALHDLMQGVPTSANVTWYARQVADAGQSRRLHSAAQRFMQIADDGQMPAAEKLSVARKELETIAADYVSMDEVPTLAEVLARPDVEPDWVIPGLLSRRDRFVLTGEEGFGKTTLFRQIMICAAAGIHPFRFTRIEPVRVLVVDAENDEDQWKAETRDMARLAATHGVRSPAETVRLHALGKRLDLTKGRDLGMVHSLLDRYPADILAIGPLYKLSPGGMNDDRDASPVLAALDSLRDRSDAPAMLMEAHAGHAVGEHGRNLRPRGSSMQLGWPEFGVGLGPDPDDDTKTVATLRRWRGTRIRSRTLPTHLRAGGDWPWMEDGVAMDWLRLKNGRDAA